MYLKCVCHELHTWIRTNERTRAHYLFESSVVCIMLLFIWRWAWACLCCVYSFFALVLLFRITKRCSFWFFLLQRFTFSHYIFGSRTMRRVSVRTLCFRTITQLSNSMAEITKQPTKPPALKKRKNEDKDEEKNEKNQLKWTNGKPVLTAFPRSGWEWRAMSNEQ